MLENTSYVMYLRGLLLYLLSIFQVIHQLHRFSLISPSLIMQLQEL